MHQVLFCLLHFFFTFSVLPLRRQINFIYHRQIQHCYSLLQSIALFIFYINNVVIEIPIYYALHMRITRQIMNIIPE